MAADSLRIVRRQRGAPMGPRQRALTAASQPVPDASRAFKNSMGGSIRNDWQNEAWDMLDAVGELRYYVGWRASSASRVRLVASEIDPTTGLPTGGLTEDEDGNVTGEASRVNEIVKAIAGGPLGQSQLLKRSTEHLTVPGETWIVILQQPADPVTGQRAPAQWLAVSRDEIKSSPRETKIELPDGTEHLYKEGVDGMFRAWNPHPRKAKEADSPVRASRDSLREIVRTTKTISNASKSRLIGNGVVFVPHEMSLPSMASTPTAAGKPGDILPPLVGTPAVQQLQELLFQVAQTAYDDEDSLAALIPMFAGVPGELIKQVSHLKFDNTVTDVALKTRTEAISRLAMGLDVSPERLLGLGSNSNHWSAWQIGDEDVQLHIVPPVETVCNAITDQVLKTVLAREGIDPAKYVVWYDVSALTADPDPAESAKEAFDRGAITAEALVRMLGLADDTVYDFSSPEGWEQWATDKASVDPTLLPMLQPFITAIADIELPQPVAALPPGQDPNADPNALDDGDPNGGEPDTEDQAAVTASFRSLSDRESVAVEVMVSRALELAAKRRRTRSLNYEMRHLPDRELLRRLEPVRHEQVADLVRGWDSLLEEPAIVGLGLDAAVVRAAVRKIVTQELTRTIDGEVVDGVA